MSEQRALRRLATLKRDMLIVVGVAFTLLILAAVGDTRFSSSGFIPVGWLGLWIVSTLGSIPLGIVLLIGPSWRSVSLRERRGIAMGYLIVGFVNLLALAMHLMHASNAVPFFMCPVGYGVVVLALYARVYGSDERIEEELFP